MERLILFWVIGLIMSIVASVPVAKAGLISVVGDTAAPSSTLGPYTMTPFPDDSRQTFTDCSFVTSPLGGNVYFNISLEHREIGDGWQTWSHGYAGDVYWTGEDNQSVTLTMPNGTSAFYLYAQPNNMAVHNFRVFAYDGVSDIIEVNRGISGESGACYFGIYGTDGSVIATITGYCETSDFAIGEFGISTLPVPGAVLLGNIGLSIVIELKRRRIL